MADSHARFYPLLIVLYLDVSMKTFANSILFYFLAMLLFSSCDLQDVKSGSGKSPVYVKPSIDRRGRFRRGHVRMPVSTKPDAVKSRNRSRYYYETRGKYRRSRSR